VGVENIFSLSFIQRFGVVPNIRLTTNKSPSQGISHSFSLGIFEGEGKLDLED